MTLHEIALNAHQRAHRAVDMAHEYYTDAKHRPDANAQLLAAAKAEYNIAWNAAADATDALVAKDLAAVRQHARRAFTAMGHCGDAAAAALIAA